MKSLWLIVFCLFSANHCNLAEGSFEARENLSFQIKAIYKGEGVSTQTNDGLILFRVQ
jgi:hypothetical protein